MKKTVSIVSLLLAMVLLLTACGGGGQNIEGTWELVDASEATGMKEPLQQAKEAGGSFIFTFKGGKMTMKMEAAGQTQENELDYEVKDGKLVTSDGTSLNIKFDGNKVTLSEGENSITLQRK